MASLGVYAFATWEGAIQGPLAAGPRLSSVRTSSLHGTASEAWAASYAYRSLVGAGGGYEVRFDSGETLAPVRVAEVQVEDVKKYRDGWRVFCRWSLLWG